MLTEFQRQKIGHLFTLYDVNQDGKIGKVDFEIAAIALVKASGFSAQSSEAAAITTSHADYWAYLQRYMDRNLDKAISIDEFVARFEFIARQPESVESLIISTCEYVVQLTDRDGDGIINRAEYVTYLVAHNIDVASANAAFDLIDHNRSNTLTRDEILNGVRMFLTSNDPTVPGNMLFGILALD